MSHGVGAKTLAQRRTLLAHAEAVRAVGDAKRQPEAGAIQATGEAELRR